VHFDAGPSEPTSSEPEIVEIPQSDLANELSVFAALIMSGLVRSHPEARRRFREDGVSVNDAPILGDKAKLRCSDVSPEGVIKLSLGHDRHVFLRPV
jgi:tyrosyl-tRNA synthetase